MFGMYLMVGIAALCLIYVIAFAIFDSGRRADKRNDELEATLLEEKS